MIAALSALLILTVAIILWRADRRVERLYQKLYEDKLKLEQTRMRLPAGPHRKSLR